MTRLSWLHLSDLLMGPKGSRWRWPEYREEFERDLRALHTQTGPWDLVLLSGDLTETGSQREFNILDSALKSFWTYLQGLGSEPLLLAVPGNHDLHQASLSAETRDRLSARRWHERSQERLGLFWNEQENALARSLRNAFLAYSSWLGLWQARRPRHLELQMSKGLLPGDFAATVVKDGLRVGIAGLNSAFLLSDAEGAKAPLDVDPRQLKTAPAGPLSRWARSQDLTLLLTHHPPARLHPERLLQLKRELAAPEGRLLHLCGRCCSGSIRSTPSSSASRTCPRTRGSSSWR